MLEDLFATFKEYYHVTMSADGTCTIRDDCPQDRFEELRKSDAEHYKKTGKHRYTNFEENQQND